MESEFITSLQYCAEKFFGFFESAPLEEAPSSGPFEFGILNSGVDFLVEFLEFSLSSIDGDPLVPEAASFIFLSIYSIIFTSFKCSLLIGCLDRFCILAFVISGIEFRPEFINPARMSSSSPSSSSSTPSLWITCYGYSI